MTIYGHETAIMKEEREAMLDQAIRTNQAGVVPGAGVVEPLLAREHLARAVVVVDISMEAMHLVELLLVPYRLANQHTRVVEDIAPPLQRLLGPAVTVPVGLQYFMIGPKRLPPRAMPRSSRLDVLA